jgi:hypothetical protein
VHRGPAGLVWRTPVIPWLISHIVSFVFRTVVGERRSYTLYCLRTDISLLPHRLQLQCVPLATRYLKTWFVIQLQLLQNLATCCPLGTPPVREI